MKVSAKVDFYSVGVILYLLVTKGKISSRNKTEKDTCSESSHLMFKEKHWSDRTEDLQEFLKACLEQDPDKRATFE